MSGTAKPPVASELTGVPLPSTYRTPILSLDRRTSTKWFSGRFVLRMRCYASGWVALALPVWTGLFKGFSGSQETFAYTGRASATQP